MSDEYQPNEVVESEPEPEVMPAEPEAATPAEAMSPSDGAAPAGDAMAPGDGPATAIAETADLTADAGATEVAEPRQPASVLPDAEPVDVTPTPVAATAPSGIQPPVTETPPATAPRVVSIADLESAPAVARGGGASRLAGVGQFLIGRLWIVAVLVAVAVLILLFLPPISLAQRITLGGGYTALDAETPSVEHPDGLAVSRAPGVDGTLRIKLGSVPQADFVDGALADDVAAAKAALPDRLVPKSPFYTIETRSREPVAGGLSIVIPNEAEPWETLDVYGWDAEAEAWTWIPSTLDRGAEVLASEITVLPSAVMVMQNEATAPKVVAEVETWPVEVAAVGIDEADVSGILIGTMGGTTGYSDQLPAADAGGSVAVAPTVRNWVPGRPENWALVSDMLGAEMDRTAHVGNLLAVAQDGGYPGLVIDYRSVPPEDRDLFSDFVAELATAFQGQGLRLAVTVDVPQPEGAAWSTGGYDWMALGKAVDELRVTMPMSPMAYAPGGEAEQLLQWATTQVARTKLMPVYSTMSTDGAAAVPMDTVLSSLGEVSVLQTVTESVVPGTALELSLGRVGVVEDPATQATSVSLGEGTYWLGTPQWLRARMDLASRYRLGGVVLRDLYTEGNMAGVMSVVRDFKVDGAGTTGSLPDVVWSVSNPAGQANRVNTQFTQPTFTWTAPEMTGTYTIAASVAGLDKGAFEVTVEVPAPVVTETLATDEDAAAATDRVDDEAEAGDAVEDATDEVEDEGADEALRAAFVADVSVPDNTQFEKGESFTKTWRLRNAGESEWPDDTVFVYVGDTQMGDTTEVEVGTVAAGDTVDISVEMVAPEEDGTFKSSWTLKSGDVAVEGGGAYVQIRVGEPAPEAAPEAGDAPAPAPIVAAPVASGGFELGGHIRDLGLPYHDKMRYAGMTWIKTQIFFGQDGVGMVGAAHGRGYKIQLSAIGGAAMVNEPGYEDKYAAWVAQLAAQGADAIEVWNEPNIDREWQVGKISPAAYTSLLCKSYNAIKAANPGTAVISAAPSPTGWFGGCGPNGCDDKPWMEGLWNSGAVNCMDYIGAHHNAGATSPSARIGHPANPGDPHHSWFFLPQTELYYNIFQGTRQLFYTEMGYASQEGVPQFSDQFAWARGTDNAEQAAWLAEAVALSINTGMVKSIVVWNIDFTRYGYDPQDGYAIVRPGGGCPACETLHALLGTR